MPAFNPEREPIRLLRETKSTSQTPPTPSKWPPQRVLGWTIAIGSISVLFNLALVIVNYQLSARVDSRLSRFDASLAGANKATQAVNSDVDQAGRLQNAKLSAIVEENKRRDQFETSSDKWMNEATKEIGILKADVAQLKIVAVELAKATATLSTEVVPGSKSFEEQVARLNPVEQHEIRVMLGTVGTDQFIWAYAKRLEELVPGNKISADYFKQQGKNQKDITTSLATGTALGPRPPKAKPAAPPEPPLKVIEQDWKLLEQRVGKLTGRKLERASELLERWTTGHRPKVEEIDEMQKLIGSPVRTLARMKQEIQRAGEE